jgi:hypothetical protein
MRSNWLIYLDKNRNRNKDRDKDRNRNNSYIIQIICNKVYQITMMIIIIIIYHK